MNFTVSFEILMLYCKEIDSYRIIKIQYKSTAIRLSLLLFSSAYLELPNLIIQPCFKRSQFSPDKSQIIVQMEDKLSNELNRIFLFYSVIDLIMWRSKNTQFKTINLCNQFLVVHLYKKKLQHQRIGMERKALVYNTAIISIKKYPLPIICLQQLKSLYGVGELLCQELIGVIKHHYQAFLKGGTTKQEQSHFKPEPEAEEEPNSISHTKSSNLAQPYKSKTSQQSQAETFNYQQDDSKSCSSFKSASMKPYKPRPKTQGAYVLTAISKCSQGDFVSKEIIAEQLKNNYNLKLTSKNFMLILSNLAKSEYIEADLQDSNMIKITNKGQKESELLQAKTKEKDSSIKVKSMLGSFLSKKEPYLQSTSSQVDKFSKSFVRFEEEVDLILLIDTRQMKDKQQQSFFQKRLIEKYGLSVKTCNLPIGDFMWSYKGQILDYVVERKKADDLISSIFDGRYKEQKYRLKNSGFSNIYYLSQGHLTGNYAKNQKEMATALLNTRIKDKFKVVQVNNITESTKFLQFITQEIRNKLTIENRVASLGTIQEVTILNGKASQLTVQHIFGLSLKTIPGVGKAAVNQVLKHFRSFREIHDKLSELEDRFQRVEFLRELLRGGGVRGTLAEALVDVVFGQ